MKKQLFLLLIFSSLTAIGCKNNDKEPIKKFNDQTEVQDEFSLNLTYPEIVLDSNPLELKKSVEKVIEIIDQSQSKLKKKELIITLSNISNTPLTIWYYNKIPLKIVHGVADDSGKIDGQFKYYLKNGKLWYSDQIFARYLFQDEKLMYWMDEQWNINDIPLKSFSNRENQLIETVKILIAKSEQPNSN